MAARFRRWNVRGVRVDRSERQCDLDRNGVVRYPPPDQWADATINDLIVEPEFAINVDEARQFLQRVIAL